MAEWLVRTVGERQQGPLDEDAVRVIIERQSIAGDAVVSSDGGQTWLPLTDVPVFARPLEAVAAAALAGETQALEPNLRRVVVLYKPGTPPRRTSLAGLIEALPGLPVKDQSVVQLDGSGPWLPAVRLLRANPDVLPKRATPFVIGSFLVGAVLAGVQTGVFGARSFYGFGLLALLGVVMAGSIIATLGWQTLGPLALMRAFWARRRHPVSFAFVGTAALGELVGLSFGVADRAVESRAAGILAQDDPCTYEAVPEADLDRLRSQTVALWKQKQEYCKARLALAEREKAKAAEEARCATLAEHLVAGNITAEEKAQLKPDDAQYIERVLGRKLVLRDFERKRSTLPCGTSQAADKMWQAHVLAAGASTEAWAEVTPSSTVEAELLEALVGGDKMSAEAKNAFAVSVEQMANSVKAAHSVVELDGPIRLCTTVGRLKLEKGPFCARLEPMRAALAKRLAAEEAAKKARQAAIERAEQAKAAAEERARVAKAAAEERAAEAKARMCQARTLQRQACMRSCDALMDRPGLPDGYRGIDDPALQNCEDNCVRQFPDCN
jgi:hypothetical protein